MARTPDSRSSAPTTRAFAAQERSMASVTTVGSSASKASMCSSSQVMNGSSQMKPYLITSASPADSSRDGSVFSDAVSMTTAWGW
ncbi:Uncharacterised protein [Klebsiella pneumoniae]|nr:Uncharacterised protein [Klebsiella pneumoniae]